TPGRRRRPGGASLGGGGGRPLRGGEKQARQEPRPPDPTLQQFVLEAALWGRDNRRGCSFSSPAGHLSACEWSLRCLRFTCAGRPFVTESRAARCCDWAG